MRAATGLSMLFLWAVFILNLAWPRTPLFTPDPLVRFLSTGAIRIILPEPLRVGDYDDYGFEFPMQGYTTWGP